VVELLEMVGQLGIVVFPDFAVETHGMVGPLGIAVFPDFAVELHETVGSPWIVPGPGASNLGHPRYFASPNVCSFPSCASSVGLVDGVFVGSSIDALSNDAPYSHSSNPMVFLYKKMERFDSSPNLNYSSASDTIALPKGATTNHRRKRCPHPNQGQHRHSSLVAPPSLEVPQIR